MQIINNPEPSNWDTILARPVHDKKKILGMVRTLMDKVRDEGDTALQLYTGQFDGVRLDRFVLGREAVDEAGGEVDEELKEAIRLAAGNIKRFHASQAMPVTKIDTMEGVTCWQKAVPIEKVGLYIPGGSAPLFSTLLMLAIPAQIAGCREIVLCTPPLRDGTVDPVILNTAGMLGLERIYRIGGAQAIAAMTYGTEQVPRVDKIFGPGNQYVTAAKLLATLEGVAIDMPAGPSEVAVIADDQADPSFVASDLLSQAEHGPDSQVLMVTGSDALAKAVMEEVEKQLESLPRKVIAEESLKHGKIIVLDDMEKIISIINAYAPEHLVINCKDYRVVAEKIENAGSVFLGPWTPESAGDYASGTNHTLPTNGAARYTGGLSLDSFQKKITFQELTAGGLDRLGPAIKRMALAERLDAHARAVSVRLDNKTS